ncbi:MAG: ABC transporter permease, partial [Candidatus Zixiibacteriota bacterium]
MSFETFIARRYFKSGRYFTSVATWITLVGVTLGVAVVCFVMSMHNGFETEIRTRLLGTTSHITVFPLRGYLIEDYRQVVDRLEKIDGVLAASPFIYYKAAISSASEGDGIIVRGIDLEKEERTANIAKDMEVGD